MTDKETTKLFNKAFKNLKKDSGGRLLLMKALKSVGLENNVVNRYRLKKMTGWREVRGTSKTFYFNNGTNHTSMPLGPNAMAMGWKNVQHPSVYAIINSRTGRAYIGSSTRPDLRRAVHLYWLKNYWKWGCSNIFFGLKAIANDVIEFGVDSFYMDILKSCPGASNKELRDEERAIAKSVDSSLIYNRNDFSSNHAHSSRFTELEPEFAKLHEYYWSNRDELFKAETKYTKFLARKKARFAKLKENRAAGMYDNKTYFKLVKAHSDDYREKKHQIQTLRKKDADLRKLVRATSNELKKKYSESEVALY